MAKIISLGDQNNYLLSTAADELGLCGRLIPSTLQYLGKYLISGVILATNKYGFRLEPVSWNEMRCPKTGVKEPRKTAKVLPQYIESSKE